jgi:hypothetical protein
LELHLSVGSVDGGLGDGETLLTGLGDAEALAVGLLQDTTTNVIRIKPAGALTPGA